MAASITARLNKPAHIFQAGESTGFGLNLGEQYYDRNAKQKEWTNYKAVVFAKNPAQINFLTKALVKGAIVFVSCKQQKIDVYEGQNGQSITIEMVDASLDNVFTESAPAQTGSYAPQQAPQQAPQAHAPQQRAPRQQHAPQQAPPQYAQQQAPQHAPPPANNGIPQGSGGFDDDVIF